MESVVDTRHKFEPTLTKSIIPVEKGRGPPRHYPPSLQVGKNKYLGYQTNTNKKVDPFSPLYNLSEAFYII